jgi:hypothetical protein
MKVIPATTGKYSCEVSADAPSFHTDIVSGDLEVVGKFPLNPILIWKSNNLYYIFYYNSQKYLRVVQ